MEEHARRARTDGIDKFLHRLHRAYLVVRVHYRNKNSVRAHGASERVWAYVSFFIRRQIAHGKSFFLQRARRLEHGLMLYGRHDYVSPNARESARGTAQSQGVRLATRAGEYYFARARAKRARDALSCALESRARRSPLLVKRGWISMNGARLRHLCGNKGGERRACGVV
ncbi:MAG: hypothetical protein UY84_C0001G0104 [Candidatus Adlerbacteria bacterium GW2011_GWA2_54_12]|nr:MAG: hypothetical protein UY84_C0001G0104 [Candidatus Adlerbacteria bacterium GW2011_GWA2_54_12]